MDKIVLAIIVVALSAGTAVSAEKKDTTRQPVVKEGFGFVGIEGTAKRIAESDRWIFVPDTDITNEIEVFKAGTLIKLLPSSTLEKIAANSQNGIAAIRLWGRITSYSNRYAQNIKSSDNLTSKNYLFPVYFMLLGTDTEEAALDAEKETKDKTPDGIGKDSILPKDVMDAFKPKRMIKLSKKIIDVEGDVVIANKTGFVTVKGNRNIFTIDGLGRNVDDMNFNILPCQTLERIDKSHTSKAGRQRFKISGILTKYKGQYHLLPQRAIRTYNHGNFAR